MTLHPNLAEAPLGVDAVGVQLAVRADVPLLLADEASGVREGPVLVLRLRAHPERVLRRAAVETDAHLRLLGHNRKISSRVGAENKRRGSRALELATRGFHVCID